MIKTRWIVIPLLISFVILPRLSVDFYLPSLPAIGTAFQVNDAYLQMTMTVFMFGYALSMLIAGPLSDVIGNRKVIIYGLFLYLISTIACAFACSITILIIARFFQALGGCCGTVIARLMVKDLYTKEHQIKVLAQLSAAMAICPLLAPIIGGTLQESFGWHAAFYFLAIFAFSLLILGKQQLEHKTEQLQHISIRTLISHYKYLLRHPVFIGYSLAIGLAWSAYFAFTIESPFLLQKTLGLNAVHFGISFSLSVLGYVIGTRLTKRFANQLGWDKLILIATFVSLIGATIMFLLISFLPLTWEILVFPMMIVMTGIGIIIPCTQGAVMQPFAHIAGTASGLFFFIQMIFGSICGLVMQIFNKTSAMPMATVILLASGLLVISFYKLIWYSREKYSYETKLF